ncbi:MAG: PRK06851 family protein [Desulfobacterales bacterium]|nr:PRK06851 family protein [Desulfobacterales bacterium]
MTEICKGRIKHVFPGGNTSKGFYSFYDYIIPLDTTRIFIIKGGPGVGKSTFMRKIGEAMLERGFDIEFHHCSSDNNSLDGVVIPTIGVALIDGTAPHIVDPKNPGCVDEIIHLGDYWDEDGMRLNKTEILDANREVGRLFNRAYRFLKAAQVVYDDWERANQEAMDYGKANKIAADLIKKIFSRDISSKLGKERHLFASAITPDGMMNYLETIVGPCKKRFIIEGRPGTGKSTVLKKIATAAIERGYDVEMYHCALNPEKVEHVVIPELSYAFTKSIEPHLYLSKDGDERIDMDYCLDAEILEKYEKLVQENEEIFNSLFNRAIKFISQAKKTHDLMETYYIPNMDFEAISQLWERTLDRIIGYAEEFGSKVS